MNTLDKVSGLITDVGLSVPANITPDQHHKLGINLVEMKERVDRGYQWAMGDWYNTIPHGDKQKEVESLGLNFKTVDRWGSVAAYYPIPRRRGMVSFTHHEDLATDARIDKHQATQLLKQAETSGWSKRDLKRERDKLLGVYEEPVNVDSSDAIQQFVEESLPNIPPKYKKQVERTVRSAAVKLQDDFSTQVQKTVKERVKAQVKEERDFINKQKAEIESEREQIINLKVGVKAFMTKEEFMLIRSCLHPDKNPNPKAAKAFEIFNRLAVVKEWTKMELVS